MQKPQITHDLKTVCIQYRAQAIIHDGKRYTVPQKWRGEYWEDEPEKKEWRMCENNS